MSVARHLTGHALREARERAHLTQEEAAARVGVSHRAYRSWESAEPPVPRPSHRRALEQFLASLAEVVA